MAKPNHWQNAILVRLLTKHLSTREIRRPTTKVLARQALIMREDSFSGPVEPDHLWRLTGIGSRIAKLLKAGGWGAATKGQG